MTNINTTNNKTVFMMTNHTSPEMVVAMVRTTSVIITTMINMTMVEILNLDSLVSQFDSLRPESG